MVATGIYGVMSFLVEIAMRLCPGAPGRWPAGIECGVVIVGISSGLIGVVVTHLTFLFEAAPESGGVVSARLASGASIPSAIKGE